MSSVLSFSIDGTKVGGTSGDTILMAARQAGIYIPYLCTYPGLSPSSGIRSKDMIFRGHEMIAGEAGKEFTGCGLCLVKIEGRNGTHRACITMIEQDMIVHTDTPELRKLRRNNLTKLLVDHPHACLLCPQREGCSLSSCSSGAEEFERCCTKFSICEIRKLVEYIGTDDNIPRYVFRHLPIVKDEPLFIRDYNLCLNCLRCVRACRELQGFAALDFTTQHGAVVVGTTAPTLRESGCKFCGACVDICPTGALVYKGVRSKSKRKVEISPPIFPPEKLSRLESSALASVPESEGVYRLLDEGRNTIYIGGTMDLRRELEEHARSNKKAVFFTFEAEPMYTRRESELLQQFLQFHGRLPEQNVSLDDLFQP